MTSSSTSGLGAVSSASAVLQVVVSGAQSEKPVAGVYHPLDEGLDFGQRLLVGPGDEPTVAVVSTDESQPVFGQFAGKFTLKGADAAPEGFYFTSQNKQLLINS